MKPELAKRLLPRALRALRRRTTKLKANQHPLVENTLTNKKKGCAQHEVQTKSNAFAVPSATRQPARQPTTGLGST